MQIQHPIPKVNQVPSKYKMKYLNPYPIDENDKWKYYASDDEKQFNFMWQMCQIQNLKPELI